MIAATRRWRGTGLFGLLMAPPPRTGIFYVIEVLRIQGSPFGGTSSRSRSRPQKMDYERTGGRTVILLQQEPGAARSVFIDVQKGADRSSVITLKVGKKPYRQQIYPCARHEFGPPRRGNIKTGRGQMEQGISGRTRTGWTGSQAVWTTDDQWGRRVPVAF